MSLTIERDELLEVLAAIWETTMDSTIEPVDSPTLLDTPVVQVSLEVHGGWDGSLLLDCSDEVTRSAAARMFELDPDAATLRDIEDAAAEIANILGGNLLSLLPEGSRIGLPVVDCLPEPGEYEEVEILEPLHLNSPVGSLTLRFTEGRDPAA